MRILLAHKFFRKTGGAEVFYFETGRVLSQEGHEVAYFSTNHPDNISSEWGRYFIDPPGYDSSSILKKLGSIRHIIYSTAARDAFAKLIDDFKPDIVHAFGIYTHLTPSIFEAARDAGVPVVMSCNDYKHICPNYKLYVRGQVCEACMGGKYYNALINKCCKDSWLYSAASCVEAYVHSLNHVNEELVQRYLFASEFMLSKTKEFWRDKDVQYGILRNPFNALQYEPVYHGNYALYFGRIIDEKGVDRLVAAASRTSVPLKIVGDGPDLDRIRHEAAEQGAENIEFLGPVWGEELDRILYGARFVVVPSLWHENFPYVIFQAFAAGKPVIGSLRGGIPELIGDDRGLLFEPDNINEMASCIERLWRDPEACARMGEHARKYILSEYNDDSFYLSLMNNYKAVLQ